MIRPGDIFEISLVLPACHLIFLELSCGHCRKLKKVYNMYMSAVSEKEDLENECRAQLAAMDDVYHGLELEFKQLDTIMREFWLSLYFYYLRLPRQVKSSTAFLILRPLDE